MNVAITYAQAEHLAANALRKAGTTASRAARVTSELLENERSGYPSHGLLRLPDYVHDISVGNLVADAEPMVTTLTPNLAIVDGRRTFGAIVQDVLIHTLQTLASQAGVAIVCLRDTHHLGRLARIGKILALDGQNACATIGFCNYQGNGPRVAAPGGHVARVCTNPMLIGFPSADPDPFVLDFSTSAVSEGFIRLHARQHAPLPNGCLVPSDGNADSVSAEDLYASPARATMAPLGGVLAGHKGYGLAVAAELLAGAFAGGPHVRNKGAPGNSGLFIAINCALAPDGVETLTRHASEILSHCRETGNPSKPARMPGEAKTNAPRLDSDLLDIGSDLLAELHQL